MLPCAEGCVKHKSLNPKKEEAQEVTEKIALQQRLSK
jgi:hypothetical protein